MRFEQITTAVVRNFVAIEARVNLVVDALAAACHLNSLRKPLGTHTSPSEPSYSHMPRGQRMPQQLVNDGGSSRGSDWSCFKRTHRFGCPALACASSPVRARRASVSTY